MVCLREEPKNTISSGATSGNDISRYIYLLLKTPQSQTFGENTDNIWVLLIKAAGWMGSLVFSVRTCTHEYVFIKSFIHIKSSLRKLYTTTKWKKC